MKHSVQLLLTMLTISISLNAYFSRKLEILPLFLVLGTLSFVFTVIYTICFIEGEK